MPYLYSMTNEEITRFLDNDFKEDRYVQISFKNREPIYGLFIKDKDFTDLSGKNFWRVVTRKNFDEYRRSHDAGLSRIFKGDDFSKLSLLTDAF